MVGNSHTGWGGVSRAFHWLLTVLLIGMIAYGWWMNHVPARPDRFFYRLIHADIGYLVALLMALRLIWRLTHPVPSQPRDVPAWMKAAAFVSHASLYLVTFLTVLLGWAHSGARKPSYASFFGWFDVPQFTSENRQNARDYENWHIYMAYVLLALIAIHLLAALFHHFVRKDDVALRMLRGRG